MLYLFYAVVILTLVSVFYVLIKYESSEYYRQTRLTNRTDKLKHKYILDSEKQSAVDSFVDYCKEEFNKRQDEK